jgi:hypothetical protein
MVIDHGEEDNTTQSPWRRSGAGDGLPRQLHRAPSRLKPGERFRQMIYCCSRPRGANFAWAVFVLAACWGCLCAEASAFEPSEIMRYEVSWNGNKAGHGDVTTKAESGQVSVTAQAVSDGVLKKVIEVWTRVQASFSPQTFKPQRYAYVLKSNLGGIETVDLSFDHSSALVQVNKRKGDSRESHAEKFAGVYDPITAIYLLRSQRDFSKPLFVDIYDGKDRSRLMVSRIGEEECQVKGGCHRALCLDLKLTKLGGDGKEIGSGKLWISNDKNHVPLLLTSAHVIGTIRLELVQLQLADRHGLEPAGSIAPHALSQLTHGPR